MLGPPNSTNLKVFPRDFQKHQDTLTIKEHLLKKEKKDKFESAESSEKLLIWQLKKNSQKILQKKKKEHSLFNFRFYRHCHV